MAAERAGVALSMLAAEAMDAKRCTSCLAGDAERPPFSALEGGDKTPSVGCIKLTRASASSEGAVLRRGGGVQGGGC